MEKRAEFLKRAENRKGFLISGVRPVLEAIEAGKEIEKVLIQAGVAGEGVRDLLEKIRTLKIPVQRVPPEKLNRLTRTRHQGVVAFLSPIEYRSLDQVITSSFRNGKPPSVVILDRVSDVRNFGAIARTAEGLGFDAIIIPTSGNAQINDEAMKSSSGALNYIPVCRENNLAVTLQYLQECGLEVIACTEKAASVIYDLDLKGPLALLFGSEENGISPLLLKKADHLTKIPMTGRIKSFNVSVSVAIAGSEVFRQRRS